MIPVERTNEEWLSDLQSVERQSQALDDLRLRLQRSIHYYLSQERSDLRGLALSEIEEMARDLAQEATLRVLSNLDAFRGESRFTTWANKIAIRVAISEMRRARYRDFSLETITAENDFVSASANVIGQVPVNPETAAERDDVAKILEAALRTALTPRQYQALVAVALDNVPMDTVAEQLGTNRNALYKLIHDARRKLKAHLEEQGLSTDYLMGLFER
ncbi:sigma-70 family RNA polymerase sigma factor [Aggregatilineales bacterium SYSU G02658]